MGWSASLACTHLMIIPPPLTVTMKEVSRIGQMLPGRGRITPSLEQLPDVSLTTVLLGRSCLHFADEGTEAQKGSVAAWPGHDRSET